MSKKNVVVVGGGGAGAIVSRELSGKLDHSKHNLTLITAHPFIVFFPAMVRTTTTAEGKLEDQALIPQDKLFLNGKGTLRIGRVVSVEDKGKGGEVVLADGSRVPYDVLVLTPGSLWSGPLDLPDSKEDVIEHINAWRKKFASANNIVLVGGGAVGIEFAGEIKQFLPKKKVTIVQSEAQLLNDSYPSKFRKAIEKDTRAVGTEIVFNDFVDNFEKLPVTTRSGKTIDADLVVPTIGGRPATEFIKSLGADVLNARGQVRVAPTLEVRGLKGVFAAGDAIEWKEQKQLAKYAAHSAVVVANVLSYLGGGTPSKEYKGSPELILITNGTKRGLAYVGMLWGITLGNWFASMMKGKSLLLDQAWKGYGYAAQPK
ncbi:FAD/NAD-P-binding domain-containing protein [Auriscalpium vulgare]|uniref:FAD/NAD-P-binding domain-containing protein n=1 Tax=Auriscalpium vulgare TaxID=40419 RepID=A0ACB8RZA7_9AGAM|nr:FAD/NAD-P-binding domain-containing protein [Auriscalpium vulgare]